MSNETVSTEFTFSSRVTDPNESDIDLALRLAAATLSWSRGDKNVDYLLKQFRKDDPKVGQQWLVLGDIAQELLQASDKVVAHLLFSGQSQEGDTDASE